MGQTLKEVQYLAVSVSDRQTSMPHSPPTLKFTRFKQTIMGDSFVAELAYQLLFVYATARRRPRANSRYWPMTSLCFGLSLCSVWLLQSCIFHPGSFPPNWVEYLNVGLVQKCYWNSFNSRYPIKKVRRIGFLSPRTEHTYTLFIFSESNAKLVSIAGNQARISVCGFFRQLHIHLSVTSQAYFQSAK